MKKGVDISRESTCLLVNKHSQESFYPGKERLGTTYLLVNKYWGVLFYGSEYLRWQRHLLVRNQLWKHQNNLWNVFKVKNDNRMTSTSERRQPLNDILVKSVWCLLILNKCFRTFFWCFDFSHWTIKSWLVPMDVHFVWSRTHSLLVINFSIKV